MSTKDLECEKTYIILSHDVEKSINDWNKKGYVLDKFIIAPAHPKSEYSCNSFVAIMIKKEYSKQHILSQSISSLKDELSQSINLLKEAISYLPGIGVEYNKSLDSFEKCKDTITDV